MRRIDQPFLDTDRYVRQQLGDETEAHARRAQRADRAARGGAGALTVRANGATLTGTVRVLDFLGAATIDGGIVTVPARLAPGAANPDTTGATLAALETEVNELKALLRAAGILTP